MRLQNFFFIFLLAAAIGAHPAPARSSANYSITAETLDGGGQTVSSSNYSLSGSIETAAIGVSDTSAYAIQHGFFSTESLALSLWEAWLAHNFPNETDPLIIGEDADWDGDLIPNLLEFAYGLSPIASDGVPLVLNGLDLSSRGLPVVYAGVLNGGLDFRAMFMRRVDFVEAGLTYTVQFSSDMNNWYDSVDTPTVVFNDGEVDLVSVPYPLFIINNGSVEKARFFRVVVTLLGV